MNKSDKWLLHLLHWHVSFHSDFCSDVTCLFCVYMASVFLLPLCSCGSTSMWYVECKGRRCTKTLISCDVIMYRSVGEIRHIKCPFNTSYHYNYWFYLESCLFFKLSHYRKTKYTEYREINDLSPYCYLVTQAIILLHSGRLDLWLPSMLRGCPLSNSMSGHQSLSGIIVSNTV